MTIIALAFLIVLGGVFVMSEMAIVSARKARLQQWSEGGRTGAGRALALANKPEHFLSTVQFAITVISILSGAIGEATLSEQVAERLSQIAWLRPYADRLAFWIPVTGIAVFSLILGELVPKRLALLNPEGIACAMARPIEVVSAIAFPLVRLMSFVTNLVLWLLGVRASMHPPITEEEINVLMQQGAEAGVFEKHEQTLVSRIFRLDDQSIRSVMTPRSDIVFFDLNDSFETNRQKLLRSGHSRFLICKGGLAEVVGVLRAKSLLDASLEGNPIDFASDSIKPLYVPETLTMIELLEAFKKHRQHLALVIDEYGEIQGLVTMNNVMGILVGDVVTVEDESQPEIVQREDGSWLVDGSIQIERFREAIKLDYKLPDEDMQTYRTLGGFAMICLGRVPQIEDQFACGDLRFEVVDMDQNRVDKLIVSRITPEPSPSRGAASRQNLPSGVSSMSSKVVAPGLFDPAIIRRATMDAFYKLDPRKLARNPVIFVTEVVSAVVTIFFVRDLVTHNGVALFSGQIAAWLWFTVLFANFAEAVAEGRGKAQADALRRTRSDTHAKRLIDPNNQSGMSSVIEGVSALDLRIGDIVLVEAGDLIPGDGEIIEGVASVNESAITGESAPVIREAGGDRSAVTGGTTVLSDWIKVRITAAPGSTFIDRMIALVEGAERQKTPNELALSILLSGLTIIFLIVCVTLWPLAWYSGTVLSVTVLIALLVCLIPTTIGGLLSAIGIAGMDRLIRFNVIATSGRAVEAAGDVDTLLLDKTGTITFGNRMADEFIPVGNVSEHGLAEAVLLASLADETPEGRSIVALAKGRYGLTAPEVDADAKVFPFSAHARISGIDFQGRVLRKGAVDAIVEQSGMGKNLPDGFSQAVERISRAGGTPLAVSENGRLLGAVYLKDIVKPDIKDRFAALRAMGIKTVMVTGDNPITAAAIASEAGVDDFIAQATPEDKLNYIRKEQQGGRLIAMCGDGTNDAPALAQADVGVAMQTGTQAAREAGNMVALDSDPTKLIEIVAIGKQLLMTRGSLTTFSIANDVAKYFAIIPALFVVSYPELEAINIMRLASPQSAILSAVIFNALIIIALIPLALKGVEYRPVGAAALLRRNLLIYGLGGIIAPFIAIKLIDLVVSALHLA